MPAAQKPCITAEQKAAYLRLPIERQYVVFCALDYVGQWKRLYFLKALRDFRKLVVIKGVAQVGINWDNLTFLVGTECIETKGKDDALHELGEYVVTFDPYGSSSWYYITNITRTLRPYSEGSDYAHPHATQNSPMCMPTGRNELQTSISERLFAPAVQIIMTALYMRAESVTFGTAYPGAELCEWPLKNGGRT